jgi:hypothetical protein
MRRMDEKLQRLLGDAARAARLRLGLAQAEVAGNRAGATSRGLGLMALVLLAGCATSDGSSSRRPPGGMVLQGNLGPSSAPRFPGGASPSLKLDTATAGCGAGNAAACVAQYGKEAASVATVANAVKGALETPKPPALDWLTRKSIEEELVKCADFARSEVLVKHAAAAHFANERPTAEECKQLSTDPRFKGKTWAQQLGIEMHEEARKCAEAALKLVVPGRFSLEQRYRYDSATKQKKPVSADHEKALVESGNASELKGSLVPDVVIHTGDVLAVQAVYDFKFPCVNEASRPRWDEYGRGHPYEGDSQGQMYEQAFGVETAPTMILPRQGVIR